jgi:hypothetical protein
MTRTVSKAETYVGYGILLVLVIISSVIFLEQFDYSSGILESVELQTESPPQSSLRSNLVSNLTRYAPEGLNPLSSAENFGLENLSDKINGKAELYLAAGFVHLSSQRFTTKESPETWLETFVYDMGSTRNSFAVYSLQRRFEAEKIALSEFAYKTENALYFVHGPYYVEMISSVAQEEMVELMLAFGKNFVRNTPVTRAGIYELSAFPSKYLSEESISLLPSDGFGFERFDSIFTAQYIIEGTELTAFLSRRQSQAEAAELVETYTSFLVAQGGIEIELNLDIPGGRLVEIMDTFELIFSEVDTLAGVHGAEDRKAAEKLALMLQEKLGGAAGEPRSTARDDEP